MNHDCLHKEEVWGKIFMENLILNDELFPFSIQT